MTLLLNAVLLISTYEYSYRITFLSKDTVDLRFCLIYQRFFKTPSVQFLQVVSCVIFAVEFLQRKAFCIFSNSLTTC